MVISKTITHVDGVALDQVTLEDGAQSVTLLGIGAVTQSWRFNDTSVVLGFDDPLRYLNNRYSLGAFVGPVANRIGGASFMVDGTRYKMPANEGRNLLHSGAAGFQGKVFAMDCDTAANSVRLTYHAADGEGGFPASVDVTIDVTLRNGRLRYDIRATADAPTPINIAQHNYYNLMGQGDIFEHRLSVAAHQFTEKNPDGLPSGAFLPTDGRMRLDGENPLGALDLDRLGLDHNYVISDGLDRCDPVATLSVPDGTTLRMWSDQPGLQVYSSGGLGPLTGGHDGRTYDRFGAICLEPQNFPDAVNQSHFPDPIYGPDRPYFQRLELELT